MSPRSFLSSGTGSAPMVWRWRYSCAGGVSPWGLSLRPIVVWLDLDLGTDRVSVILELVGVLDQGLLVFLLDVPHLDLRLLHVRCGRRLLRPPLDHVADGAVRARMLDRLL